MKLTVLGAAKPAQSSSADVAELGQGQPRTSNIANQQHRPVAGHGIIQRARANSAFSLQKTRQCIPREAYATSIRFFAQSEGIVVLILFFCGPVDMRNPQP